MRGLALRFRVLAALAVTLACAGCGPTASAPEAPVVPAGVEALGYLPADAEVVAILDTDLRGSQWRATRAALAATGLDRLADEGLARLEAAGLATDEARGLFGNRMAVAPREGIAAMVVLDPDLLGRLTAERSRAGILRGAGIHREAELFEGEGAAVAVRGSLLLLGRDTETLREALDRQATNAGYEATTFNAAVADLPARSLVRVAVDPRPWLARHARGWRDIPYVGAARSIGLAVQVGARDATVHLRADTSGDDLLPEEVPLPRGAVAAPAVSRAGATAALIDLPHLIRFAYASAFTARPDRVARAELATVVLRGRRRIDPPRALLDALAGPATLALDRGGVLLRAELKDPKAAQTAIGRLSARLPKVLAAVGVRDVEMRSLPRFMKAVVRKSDVLAVFGVDNGALVAGSGRPSELAQLAAETPAAPWAWAKGPFALRVTPGTITDRIDAIDAIGEARLWLRAGPRILRGRLQVQLP
jgi:hypothetical protein